MRLDQLILHGFGRFTGETMDLSAGLNVIYGPNEAGKSTLQRFIIGMFYGQKKRGQRREFSDDSARSRPWQGDSYRGTLLYTLERSRRAYRIEREFDQRSAAVKIFDGLTGADLSEQYPMDRRKERLFAEAQFGLSEDAFRSTAWVGQLQVGKVELGQELITRVGNLRDSGRDDLSVRSALAALDDKMREIGSDRASTKPYARLTRAIQERRQLLERALAARAQSQTWEAQLAEVRQTIAHIDTGRQELQRVLGWALWREGKSRLERVSEAVGCAQIAHEQANALASFAQFPIDRRDRLLRTFAEYGSAKEHAGLQQEQLDRLLAERDQLGERLDRFAGLAETGAQLAEQLATQAHSALLWSARAPELQAEAERLREQVVALDQRIEPLRSTAYLGQHVLADLEALDRERAKPAPPLSLVAQIGLLIATGLLVASVWLAVLIGQGWTLIGGIVTAVLIGLCGIILIGFTLRDRPSQRVSERFDLLETLKVSSSEEVRNRLADYEKLMARRDGHQSRLELVQVEVNRMEHDLAQRIASTASQIANALGVNPGSLPSPVEQFHQAYAEYQDLQRQAERLERDLAEARRRLREDQTLADRHQAQAQSILAEAGVTDLSEFEAGCARRLDHTRLVAEATNLKAALTALLEGQDADDLAAEVERLEAALVGPEPLDHHTSPTLQTELRRLESQRAGLTEKAIDLSARVETTLGDSHDTPDLEREIAAMTEERRLMDEEIAALELARNVLVSVSTEVHREFAPKLNEEIGRVVTKLTMGRYRTVRIDESLGIRAITSEGRTVEIQNLSAGTIDQFYFGLRIALLDLITDPKEPVPLILDDPFVQYDQNRLKASLDYLGQVAAQRQIILLTCHQREVQAAQALTPPVNLIRLSNETAVD